MKVLGINDSHDSGVVLFDDGKVIFAINQERLDRIKLSSGFPIDSLDYLTKNLNIKPEDIDCVAVSGVYGPWIEPHTGLKSLQTSQAESKERSLLKKTSNILAPLYRSQLWNKGIRYALKATYRDRKDKVRMLLKSKGFVKDIAFVDHHLCHAASALFSCQPETFAKKTLVITSDGAGDGLSGAVYIAENGVLTKIHEINQYNSLGMVYSYVTEICGFTPMKHEGKITGLAAFGKPEYLPLLDSMIEYKNGTIYNRLGKQHEAARDWIKKKIGTSFSKENLAASAQAHLEKVAVQFIDHWVQKTGISEVLVAGGIFANVKLNQRINELPSVTSFFVHQNMGDGGIAFGAAALLSFKMTKKYSPAPKHVYFGNDFTEEEIKVSLEKYKVPYKRLRNIEKEVARLLSKGFVIARCNGRMEYGPRALGNRTILYATTDATVNDWLNKRLKRTEFMPFAPVTLLEAAPKCYRNIKGAEYAARFMTITFDCTEYMKKTSPAVVHIDGTARPQLIDKDTNPGYRKILEEYYKITGIPSLVNTSFNMHEEPIVCTPDDAVRSFLTGNLDYLALGDFLVSTKNSKQKESQ